MRELSNLAVGSLVIARRTTGVCDAGERGVCYEEYTLPDGQGGRRSGWSFIFESGRHDGYSPNEVELMLAAVVISIRVFLFWGAGKAN